MNEFDCSFQIAYFEEEERRRQSREDDLVHRENELKVKNFKKEQEFVSRPVVSYSDNTDNVLTGRIASIN